MDQAVFPFIFELQFFSPYALQIHQMRHGTVKNLLYPKKGKSKFLFLLRKRVGNIKSCITENNSFALFHWRTTHGKCAVVSATFIV